MSKYRMDDGTLVDTERATDHWDQARDWEGSKLIGRASGSQWHDRTLYRSRKGRYYVEHYCSLAQGGRSRAEWVSPEEATRWLLHNDHELPEALKRLEDEVTE